MFQTKTQDQPQTSPRARYLSALVSLSGSLLLAFACSDGDSISTDNTNPPMPDSGSTPNVPDAGDPSAGDSGSGPTDPGDAGGPFGGLEPDIAAAEHQIDLFGSAGHHIWLEVSDEQQELMNAGTDNYNEDPYAPGDSATFADHMVIEDATSGSVADYGKTDVHLVGESTARAFDRAHIPNFRIDTNHFQPGLRIDGFEHIRLNNAQVGTIFRETLTHQIFAALDYPALRASFAFVGTNVWGPDVWVPMTLIEVYKTKFCEDNAEAIGGTCLNMWEFAGDIGQGGGGFPGPGFPIDIQAQTNAGDIIIDPGPIGPGAGLPPNACQIEECDNQRLDELANVLTYTYRGDGFKDALEPFIDWDRFHQFQCLNWMLWVGDDPIHNSNNNLIIEREDGKLMWAPYSVDISMGQSWYVNVPLTGSSSIASGCQLDPACWEDTIAACEDLIQRFDELNPEEMLDQTVQQLTDLGMMRDGDEERADEIRAWLVHRQEVLSDELEIYRYLPDADGNCPNDLMLCLDNSCGTFDQCAQRCESGLYWCDSKQSCVSEYGDFCPACPEDTPLWCDFVGHRQCVASTEACQDLCADDEGYAYCPLFDACTLIEECTFGGDGDGDGGFEPPVIEDAGGNDAGDGG
ncbi:MAG TPA: CotH kinase family protein [Polyangiaceae bacterium]|nr:CotH kinase family protein [Polyangiaceae bacterium]